MKRNTASQVIGVQMVAAADGAAFTGAVTVHVTGDGGVQALGLVGSGVCTHEGNGFHTYAPAQVETDYTHVAFTFVGTGAVPATLQAYTAFPQTGDGFARLGAPAGASVSADIAAVEAQTDDIGALGAGLTGLPWNAAWDAEVQSEAADALAVYDPPTHTELVAEADAVQVDIAALNDLSAAQVNAEVKDVLETDTHVESAAIPAATASLKDKIVWLATLGRNKILQTATLTTVRNNADNADISTSVVSDDGTTFNREKWG